MAQKNRAVGRKNAGFGKRLAEYTDLVRTQSSSGQKRGRSGNWPIYAAAAGSALAMASNASASLIYCGASNNYCESSHQHPHPVATAAAPLHIPLGTTSHGANAATHQLLLNVDAIAASAANATARGGNHMLIFDTLGSALALNFSGGQKIGSSLLPANNNSGVLATQGLLNAVSKHGSVTGNFVSSIKGLVGFRLSHVRTQPGGATTGVEYGWIRLEFFDNGHGVPSQVKAIDWGLNLTPGQSINAGVVAGSGYQLPTPEPGTLPLALLASGAAGVLALRRRRGTAKEQA